MRANQSGFKVKTRRGAAGEDHVHAPTATLPSRLISNGAHRRKGGNEVKLSFGNMTKRTERQKEVRHKASRIQNSSD